MALVHPDRHELSTMMLWAVIVEKSRDPRRILACIDRTERGLQHKALQGACWAMQLTFTMRVGALKALPRGSFILDLEEHGELHNPARHRIMFAHQFACFG